MTTGMIIVDILAILLVVAGVHLAFRQRQVLSLLARFQGRPPPPPKPPGADESPAHYAMIIFGVMMIAFGLIILGFTIAYSIFTAGR